MKILHELGHLFVFAFLFYFASSMVIPAITDVTMDALCPGRDECSLAIYLAGFQQAITGIGTLLATPFVGNLSDRYGRKALLILPAAAAVVPSVILACSRTRANFYAYYATKLLTGMVSEDSMQCLSLAYVADKTSEGQRAAAFSLFTGVSAGGFVFGTVAARFLPASSTFQVSAVVAIGAAVYMRVFVQETDGRAVLCNEGASQPLRSPSSDGQAPAPRLPPLRKIPSLSEMAALFTSSSTLSRASVVVFFHGLGETGLQTALLYYLKAQFHFSKNQYANLLLTLGIAGSFSQLTLMPLLAPTIGEEKLLNIGLLASCTHVLLYSIAWSYWVPYFAASFVVASIFVDPCIRSIVSRKVGSSEQGMAQGCVTGISSFASIVSPLVFTPLTAWFLSEGAPFNFKGFSIACAGFAMLVALTMSITMSSVVPVTSHSQIGNEQA